VAGGQVTQAERRPELVKAELLARYREERIEPPARIRIDRIVASALHQGEETLFGRVAGRLPAAVRARMEALIAAGDDRAEEDQAAGRAGPRPAQQARPRDLQGPRDRVGVLADRCRDG
jgi:hypothetical protein